MRQKKEKNEPSEYDKMLEQMTKSVQEFSIVLMEKFKTMFDKAKEELEFDEVFDN